MKVLLKNGSPRTYGNTYLALSEVAGALKSCGIEAEIISLVKRLYKGVLPVINVGNWGDVYFRMNYMIRLGKA